MKYTREQILAMDAAQLRMAIAEKLGYVKAFGRMDSASQRDHVFYVKPDGRFTSYIPDWPNDIAAAWELVEEAAFVIGPEYSGGFDSVRVGWAVYADWMVAADDTYSMPGNAKALAVEETAPLAIARAWLMWKEGV